MDPQFAPRVLARPLHTRVVDTIGAAADDTKVAVFRRFAIMQHWISSGQYRLDEVISRDGLHLNDLSYGCIARLLADSLAAAARRPLDREGRRRYRGAACRARSALGNIRASCRYSRSRSRRDERPAPSPARSSATTASTWW